MQNAAPVHLRQVRDFGQLISTTFTFLKQNWRPLFRAIATLCLPVAIIGGSFAGGSMATMQRASMTPSDDPMAVFTTMGTTMVTLIPAYLLLFLDFVLLVALVYEYMRAYDKGEHHGITTGELWRRAWPQLGSYFVPVFLTGLIIGVGTVLCILPGLYFMTVFALVYACHAFERCGGGASLGRSMQLVSGDFWPTLGLALVILIIYSLVNYVFQIPVFIVTFTATMNSTMSMLETGKPGELPGWFDMFMLVATAIQWCVTILTYPIVAVCMCLKYFSRVEEKEAPALRERIQGFEQA